MTRVEQLGLDTFMYCFFPQGMLYVKYVLKARECMYSFDIEKLNVEVRLRLTWAYIPLC